MSDALIARIDAAIDRLQKQFDPDDPALSVTLTIAIANLREKRALVVSGEPYVVSTVDVEPALRVFGELICENVKSREAWYRGANG